MKNAKRNDWVLPEIDIGLFLGWSERIGATGEHAWTRETLKKGLGLAGMIRDLHYLDKSSQRQLLDLVWSKLEEAKVGTPADIIVIERNNNGALFIVRELKRDKPFKSYFQSHSSAPAA